jgi:hypothetical protein
MEVTHVRWLCISKTIIILIIIIVIIIINLIG